MAFFYPRPLLAPLLLLLALLTAAQASQAQTPFPSPDSACAHWDDRFSLPGLNGVVTDVTTLPNGDVVACGSFTNAGGDPAADYVARWTGTSWLPVGNPPAAHYRRLTILPSGGLLASGDSIAPTGVIIGRFIFHWDGVAWHDSYFPSGLDGEITDWVFAPNGDALVCGSFTDVAGDTAADYLARYDGVAWHPLAPGADSIVGTGRAVRLTINSLGELIMCVQHGLPARVRIHRWDGTRWHTLGSPQDGQSPLLVAAPDSSLLLRLSPSAHGNVYDSRVLRWNGTAWLDLSIPYNSGITDLTGLPNGGVAVCGWSPVIMPGGEQGHVLQWDGSQWQLVGPATLPIRMRARPDRCARWQFTGRGAVRYNQPGRQHPALGRESMDSVK